MGVPASAVAAVLGRTGPTQPLLLVVFDVAVAEVLAASAAASTSEAASTWGGMSCLLIVGTWTTPPTAPPPPGPTPPPAPPPPRLPRLALLPPYWLLGRRGTAERPPGTPQPIRLEREEAELRREWRRSWVGGREVGWQNWEVVEVVAAMVGFEVPNPP